MVSFRVVLRGYDRSQVDELVGRIARGLESTSPEVRAETRSGVRNAQLRVVLRGYDRAQVDAFLDDAAQKLA